ncbi:hypothetical protein E2C01_085990 [Portunus trituberculatus]|uniref:Uncharacterized protein n=1 Tax=Portunus trituberculatus TaxID=210409 RepID=A0A5B7J4A2_PORTR|nr:hypothetical protein [Portunus trituberculatus]
MATGPVGPGGMAPKRKSTKISADGTQDSPKICATQAGVNSSQRITFPHPFFSTSNIFEC